tara:strand:- start:160 stop:684 length:525 start_codon:yes stop_codon:yes gene_type:complete
MAITCTTTEGTFAAEGIPLLADITNSTFAINDSLTLSGTAGEQNISGAISFQSMADLNNQLNLTLGGDGTSVLTVAGNWDDPFNDQFTYVEKGTDPSLYPKTPVTVTQVGNMPSDKLMYNLNQDNAEFVTKGLFITVTYEDTNGVAQPNVYFYPEVKLYNSYERIRSFISNYYT